MMMHPDLLYGGVASAAIGGLIAPLLFAQQLPQEVRTASLIGSIAASGALAYAHHSGVLGEAKNWHRQQKESHIRLREERLISQEFVATQQIERQELMEVLLMLDHATVAEQRYFLGKLNLLELLPIYQDNRVPLMAEPAIETKAVEVKEPQPEFAGTLEWAVQSVLTQAMQPQPTEGIVDETFSEVDLGKAIAEMMTSGDVPLCVLIACAPRTGKTTLLTTTIAWLHKLTEGNAQVRIWNGKEKRTKTGELEDKFLGLVNDPTRYYAIKTPAQAKYFAEQYHKETVEMDTPRSYPDVDIVDEINNIRPVIEVYDVQNNLTKNNAKLTQFDGNSSMRVTQGTSRLKFTVMTSHSSYVGEIGINRSLQDGIYTIVLGRGGALDPIYKSLRGNQAIVRNAVLAKKLLKELEEWETSPTRDHSKVVALTNLIDGTYKLYFVKRIDLNKVSFAPVAPAAKPSPLEQDDPYAMWDEQFEDEVGHQPEDDPSWKPPTPNPNSRREMAKREAEVKRSQQELIAALLEWINQAGKTPSDTELKAKAEELLQSPLSDNALKGIKWLLHNAGVKFN